MTQVTIDITSPHIEQLVIFCAHSPRTDPGDGDWSSIEAAFRCGTDAEAYEAATLIRPLLALLTDLDPASFAGQPMFECVDCGATWPQEDGDKPVMVCADCDAPCHEVKA